MSAGLAPGGRRVGARQVAGRRVPPWPTRAVADQTAAVDIPAALDYATEHRRSILVTLRRDGRPQSSNVMHVVHDGTLWVSVTADRAKTRNAQRDPRVSLHVLGPDFWSYVVIDADVDLLPAAVDPHDATADALVEYYRAASGEHPDWNEYRATMVADQRLLLVLHPSHAYGMVPGR